MLSRPNIRDDVDRPTLAQAYSSGWLSPEWKKTTRLAYVVLVQVTWGLTEHVHCTTVLADYLTRENILAAKTCTVCFCRVRVSSSAPKTMRRWVVRKHDYEDPHIIVQAQRAYMAHSSQGHNDCPRHIYFDMQLICDSTPIDD